MGFRSKGDTWKTRQNMYNNILLYMNVIGIAIANNGIYTITIYTRQGRFRGNSPKGLDPSTFF